MLSTAVPFSPPGRPAPTAGMPWGGGGRGDREGGLSPLRPHEGRRKNKNDPQNLEEISRKWAIFALRGKTQRGAIPPGPALSAELCAL